MIHELTLLLPTAGLLLILGYVMFKGMRMGKDGIPFVKLLFQGLSFFALIGADIFMFWYLISGLLENTVSAEIAALLSAAVTAVTGALALAARDFFNAQQDDGA